MPVASLTELLDRIPVRYRAMLLLATFASLRFGELAALHREDIDLEHCCVRAVRSLVQTDDGRLIDAEPKPSPGLAAGWCRFPATSPRRCAGTRTGS